MILDFTWRLIDGILAPVVDLLPSGHLSLPDPTGIGDALSNVDSLVPILGVLRIGAVMLLALVAFFGVRIVILIWQQVKW